MAQMNNTVQVPMNGTREGLPVETCSWPKIFQVPHYLRKLNEDAYEPKFISIGPYHRQKDNLKAMETHKVRFQEDLLRRSPGNSAQTYREAMRGMMEEARKYYAESLVIDNEEFIETMVLDGCFIVELICKFKNHSFDDSVLKVDHIYLNILQDLILVENQLPFFVLWKFLGMIEDPRGYFPIILKMYEHFMRGLRVSEISDENSVEKVKHLLHLLYTNWIPEPEPEPESDPELEPELEPEPEPRQEETLCDFILSAAKLSVAGIRFRKSGEPRQEETKWDFILSAAKLRKAGIRFRKGGEGCNLFDIKFQNGILYIPAVNFQDQTEILFFNIIAYEQFDDSGSRKYLSEYVTVMDFLIDTEKDVELLCQKEIMNHWLGTDEAVAKMFNRLGSELVINPDNFFYTKLFNDVNKYYRKPCNKRMASLWQVYFNTPWALISFFAATFLLLLALLQTTFTIFPRS